MAAAATDDPAVPLTYDIEFKYARQCGETPHYQFDVDAVPLGLLAEAERAVFRVPEGCQGARHREARAPSRVPLGRIACVGPG